MNTAGKRLRVGTRAHLQSFIRHPAHVLFLLLLPPVVIEVYGVAMESFPQMPLMETLPSTMGRISGAVFAAAFLAGLIGLFQVLSARQADGRLQLCGFRPAELFLTRLVTILTVSLLAAVAAFAVLFVRVDVAAPLPAFGALAIAAGIYGLLGVLVGALVPKELEGSLVLVFVADFDAFVSSGLVQVDSEIKNLMPLHYPHEMFRTAVQDGDVAGSDVFGAFAFLATAFVLVLVTYLGITGRGGVTA